MKLKTCKVRLDPASQNGHSRCGDVSGNTTGTEDELERKTTKSRAEINEIISLFRDNLTKSKQLFHALKDIPPHGHETWKLHFGKTFEMHTFVWKFQQRHRSVLVEYGDLERHEIGEIASKIGQLYYQYYIRTSDLSYLHESFNFYNALRLRNYFKNAENESTSYFMLKKLRFYTRYIVVILLLGKFRFVLEVMKEFFHFVAQFSSIYAEENQEEWAIVCSELQSFNQKLTSVKVIATATTRQGNPIHLDPGMRLAHDWVPSVEDHLPIKLTIGRAIIMGNSMGQVINTLHSNPLYLFYTIISTCFIGLLSDLVT